MRSRRSRRWPTRMPTPAVLNNLGVVQLRRGGAPQTGQPTVLLQQGGRGRPRRADDFFFNLGLRLLARARPAGGDLLAARGGAAQSGRRRRALRARRGAGAPAAAAPRRAREGTGAPAVVHLRAVGQAAGGEPCRRGSSGSRTTSSCRTPGRSTRGSQRRAADQRGAGAASTSIAAGGCSSRRTIARRWPS